VTESLRIVRAPRPLGLLWPLGALGLVAMLAWAGVAAAEEKGGGARGDTLVFSPAGADTSTTVPVPDENTPPPRAPRGELLLTDTDTWHWWGGARNRLRAIVDYNRVDRLRLGLGYQVRMPKTLYPRIGARIEYPFDRDITQYAVQLEQPIVNPSSLAIGASMVRRTDHSELQQVEDEENSLNLLLAKLDYRDYWEREGFGAYAVYRIPHVTTVSAQVRRDSYRSLALIPGTRSWFFRDRPLRDNPAIDDGEGHLMSLRLEHLAHPIERLRPGIHHWIDLERAGHGMGGDFDYTRLVSDVRSVLRLSPATTLALRGVLGHTFDGTLPVQRRFPLGGPDGLRAHEIAQFHGSEITLAQAEYTIGLPRLRSEYFEGGLHAIAFVESGVAWDNPGHSFDVDRQRFETDGGFGLGTTEDHLRVYFAKDLHRADSDFVMTVRLTRPF